MSWNSKNRRKYLLQCHIIFVCKYRKKLLNDNNISRNIKQLSFDICNKHNINIKIMGTDKDHIHYLIEADTTISVSKIVNLLKSYTTYHMWRKHNSYLSKCFWKEKTFWTDGYFACSVGNVSKKSLREYIDNQG